MKRLAQVTFTRGQAEQVALYQQTDEEATLGLRQLAAGIIQHPDTGLWQVWLSTNGLDFTQLAAFKDEGKAGRVVGRIQWEAQAGYFYDEEMVADFFSLLAYESDGDSRGPGKEVSPRHLAESDRDASTIERGGAMSDQPKEAPFSASGKYEYSYHQDNAAHLLQIFSHAEMRSIFHDVQETLYQVAF